MVLRHLTTTQHPWTSLTIVRHGQDGDLRDGPCSPLNPARSLVDGRQIRVHVTGVTAATRHLFSGGRHLEGAQVDRGTNGLGAWIGRMDWANGLGEWIGRMRENGGT